MYFVQVNVPQEWCITLVKTENELSILVEWNIGTDMCRNPFWNGFIVWEKSSSDESDISLSSFKQNKIILFSLHLHGFH